MKHIVIADDSDFKRETIEEYMRKLFPTAEIHTFEFVNPTLMFVGRENEEDIKQNPSDWLVVTDMIMPRYRGAMPDAHGGQSILREMRRLRFKCPAILQSSEAPNFEENKTLYDNLLGVMKESPIVYNLSKYKELLKDYVTKEEA